VERTLDDNYVIDLWLEGLEDHVELPSTTSALVDHEFGVRLEGTQGLKAHLEYQRVIGAEKAVTLLLEEHRTLNKAFVLRILDIELIAESISWAEVMEARQDNAQGLIVRSTCPGLEMIVDGSRCTFSDSSERIFPYQLFAHAHDDGGFAFCHCLR
jgi:hypothetical protein